MIKLPPVNLLALLPVLITTVTGLLMLCWDLGMRDEERHRLAWLGIFGLAVTAVVSFCLLGYNQIAFNGSIALDGYAMFFNLIFCLAGILTLLMSANYLKTPAFLPGDYFF